jgi:hypothetical protein
MVTRTVTVTSAAWTDIAPTTFDTRELIFGEIIEAVGYPTTDYLVKWPGEPDASARRIMAGQEYSIRSRMQRNVVHRQVKTVTGTTTFFVDEK